eukprot:gene4172-5222_t
MSASTTTNNTTVDKTAIVKELDNILFRFALIDGEKGFDRFLEQYLVQVIDQLKFQDEPAVKKKVLEVLSNINKRTLVSANTQYPVSKLLDFFSDPTTSMISKNFAIIYLEKGFKNLSKEDKLPYLNNLILTLHKLPQHHRDIFCHIIINILIGLTNITKIESEREKLYSFKNSELDCKILFSFFLDLLLTPPPNMIKNAEGVVLIPACHSQQSLQRIMGNTYDKYDYNALSERKLSVLNLLSSGLFPDTDVLVHFIIGSTDIIQPVAKKSEETLKRLPKINWENPQLIDQLYQLFQGTPDTVTDVAMELRKRPASPLMREKILGCFNRSLLACNKFPATLQVIFESVYGSTSTLRLKQTAISFVQWVFRHASDVHIKSMGEIILTGLLKLLKEMDEESAKELNELKAFTYTSLGLLCKRNNDLFRNDLELVYNLMKRVTKEDSLVSSAIQDALTMIREAFIDPKSPEIVDKLVTILMTFIYDPEYQIRSTVLKWAQHCLPFENIQSRYISLVMSGDVRPDIREEAKRGLEPYLHQGNMMIPGSVTKQPYPDFLQLLNCILENRKEIRESKRKLGQGVIQVLGFTPTSYEHILELLRTCIRRTAFSLKQSPSQYLQEIYTKNPDAIKQYRELIETGLESKGGDDLYLVCCVSLLQLFNLCPQIIPSFTDRLDFFKSLLKSGKYLTRDLIAKMIGLISNHLKPDVLDALLKQYLKIVETENDILEVYGPMSCISHIIAANAKQWYLEDKKSSTETNLLNSSISRDFINFTMKRFIDHTNLTIKTCAIASIGLVGMYRPLPFDLLEEKTKIVTKFIHLIGSGLERNIAETAIQSLGWICNGEDDGQMAVDLKKKVVDSLFTLVNNKNEEMQFTIGETLSLTIGGAQMKESLFPFSPFSSEEITTERNEELEILGSNQMDTGSTATTETENKELVQLFERILNNYFSDRQSPITRCSAGIWMVCLLKNFGKLQQIQDLLAMIQNGFVSLLSDNNELTQEVASKGITLVYESSQDPKFKEFLVSNLSKTLQGKPTTKTPGSSELLPEGAVTKTGQVSTFKELSSVATDLGKPDMIYKFMNLSSHHQIWNSKKGASFAIVSLATKAKDDLAPLLPYLVPKIYRYLYDPSPKISQSMKNIMNALIETKDIFPRFFDPIMKELIQGMGNNAWRVREASSAALPDTITHASPDQLLPYLEELFYMNFRTLDDIKESVRKAAEASIKSLGSVSARMSDPNYTTNTKAEDILKIVLPFLLHKGITNESKEVKIFTIQQLQKIATNSRQLIKPYVPEMVTILLESLSTLEPAQFNYASFHAESLNVTQEQLESIRLEISRNSPLNEILELCLKQLDSTNLTNVLTNLIQIIQFSVGIVTRVGVAKFVSSIFQQQRTIQLDVPEQIIQKLINAIFPSITDRSTATRNQFISTLSFVVKKSPAKLMKQTVSKVIELVSPSTDPDQLELHLIVVGTVFKEFYKNATSEIQSYNKDIIPFVYFYKTHPKKEIADLYKLVWEEHANTSIKLYTDELIELIVSHLTSNTYSSKEQAALCLSSLTEDIRNKMDTHLPVVLNLIIQGLKGRTYPGKDSLLGAMSSVCSVCADTIKNSMSTDNNNNTSNNTLPKPIDIVNTMIQECKKNDLDYKRKAISNLALVLHSLSPVDVYDTVKEVLFSIVFEQDVKMQESNNNNNPEEEDPKQKPLKILVRASVYNVIGDAFYSATTTTQLNNIVIVDQLVKNLEFSIWNEQVSILSSLKLILKSIWKDEDQKDMILSDHSVENLLTVLFNSLSTTKFQVVKKGMLDLLEEIVIFGGKFTMVQKQYDQIISNVEQASKKDLTIGVQVDKLVNQKGNS